VVWRFFIFEQEPEMGRSINLEGKVAMITGASSGLGKRFAQVLSQAGAKVVLASRRVERLKELRAEIEASGGAAHVVSLDVTDYQSIRSRTRKPRRARSISSSTIRAFPRRKSWPT
jgi:NADP-dependent 3-hydroxy acid dehydrogenase YdfG